MYFLSAEEKRYVLRHLLPRSRQEGVHPDLRGWNWHRPPLSPIYDVKLGLYEVAGKYCATGRDVYLRRVEGIEAPPNRAMIEGLVLHGVLVKLILAAKREIYCHGAECLEALASLADVFSPSLNEWPLAEEERQTLRARARVLWDFEHHRVTARVEEALAKQPYVGPDSLVALALPITVEQKLDGTFLGLSSHLSADAFAFSEPMMMDIKFGKRRDFHRLTTTGYALVMESVYEFPVNVGCIVYPEFRGNRLLVERDFHLIDDELRQWFIEERDELGRLIEEEIDPGLMDGCYEVCHYRRICHPEYS